VKGVQRDELGGKQMLIVTYLFMKRSNESYRNIKTFNLAV
jgi:hypothetical protein